MLAPRSYTPNPARPPATDPAAVARLTRTHSAPRSYYASSVATGGYHFFVQDDDSVQRQNAQVRRILDQTAQRRAADTGVGACLRWLPGSSEASDIKAHAEAGGGTKNFKLSKYEINGFEYASKTKATPPPEQNATPGHWVCEVNSVTGRFNPITGGAMNVWNESYREAEVRRYRSFAARDPMQAAGQVQPQVPITCHDIQGFVPVRKQEKMPNYAIIQRNL
eukprot:g11412.t1